MLARCARTRPCLDRFSRESSTRSTWILSASALIVMPAGTLLESSPFGPLTLTEPGFCESVTPLGMGSIFRPMRDISPNLAEKLAAQTLFAGGPIGHEPFRRRQDRDAEARAHLGDGAVANVHPLARPRTAPEPGDGVGARVGPAQLHHNLDGGTLFVAHVVARDVTLVFQQHAELLLQLRRWRDHLGVSRQDGIVNPRQKVCDGIGHRHSFTYLPA